DLQLQPVAERVDRGHADAVQAARDLVALAAELAAGVEHRHHDLGRRPALAGHDVDRDAAAVVLDRHRVVEVDHHLDPAAVAGQVLVDRVVDHLVDEVVQSAAVIGVADVHARALAHTLQALEDADRAGVVAGVAIVAVVTGIRGVAAGTARRSARSLLRHGSLRHGSLRTYSG